MKTALLVVMVGVIETFAAEAMNIHFPNSAAQVIYNVIVMVCGVALFDAGRRK